MLGDDGPCVQLDRKRATTTVTTNNNPQQHQPPPHHVEHPQPPTTPTPPSTTPPPYSMLALDDAMDAFDDELSSDVEGYFAGATNGDDDVHESVPQDAASIDATTRAMQVDLIDEIAAEVAAMCPEPMPDMDMDMDSDTLPVPDPPPGDVVMSPPHQPPPSQPYEGGVPPPIESLDPELPEPPAQAEVQPPPLPPGPLAPPQPYQQIRPHFGYIYGPAGVGGSLGRITEWGKGGQLNSRSVKCHTW